MYNYELLKNIFCNMNMHIFQGRCMKEKIKKLNDKIINQFFKQYNFSESIGIFFYFQWSVFREKYAMPKYITHIIYTFSTLFVMENTYN